MNREGDYLPTELAQHPLFIGVDVGGSSIKIGVVDDSGQTLAATQIPTHQERGPADAIPRVIQAIEGLFTEDGLNWESVAAVGLGTPGTMDVARGMILQPHNLPGWRDFPIRDALSHAARKPVAYSNDANAAAYGEYWVGSGKEYHSIILLTLGTGIGGGIIIRGLSIDGENSHGSEVGHIIIDYNEDARVCACGKRGHLEAYASAKAVVKRTEELLESGRTSTLEERCRSGEQLTPLMVSEEAAKDDPVALEIVLETASLLSVGIVSLMHTVDPGAVILGGAMDFGGARTKLGLRFLERVRAEVHHRAFPVLAERTVVDFATLGGNAGYIGAAAVARALYRTECA